MVEVRILLLVPMIAGQMSTVDDCIAWPEHLLNISPLPLTSLCLLVTFISEWLLAKLCSFVLLIFPYFHCGEYSYNQMRLHARHRSIYYSWLGNDIPTWLTFNSSSWSSSLILPFMATIFATNSTFTMIHHVKPFKHRPSPQFSQFSGHFIIPNRCRRPQPLLQRSPRTGPRSGSRGCTHQCPPPPGTEKSSPAVLVLFKETSANWKVTFHDYSLLLSHLFVVFSIIYIYIYV